MGRIGLALWDRLSNHRGMEQQALTWRLVDETAAALGANEATRRKWRQIGRGVPPIWRIKIVEAIGDRVPVSMSDFDQLPVASRKAAA